MIEATRSCPGASGSLNGPGQLLYDSRYQARKAMAVDLKSLKKLESLPASLCEPRSDDDRLVVLVKLRTGANQPSYLTPRAHMGPQIFSAEISAGDLPRMESDSSIESVSVTRRLPLIE